jgi:hypothetical protein
MATRIAFVHFKVRVNGVDTGPIRCEPIDAINPQVAPGGPTKKAAPLFDLPGLQAGDVVEIAWGFPSDAIPIPLQTLPFSTTAVLRPK